LVTKTPGLKKSGLQVILHKNMLVELEQYFFGDYEPIFGKSPKAQGVKFFFDVKKKMPQV